MALQMLPWDPAEHLKTAEDVKEYLEAAFEDGDPALIAAAPEDLARASGYGAELPNARNHAWQGASQ